MTLNDILTRQNVLTKLVLEHDGKELSKELKVKIMRIRRAYNKVRKNFDEDVQEFLQEIVTDELKTLSQKSDRTQEEEDRFNKLNSDANASHIEYLNQKGNEEVKPIDDTFTEQEYNDILDINSSGEVEINGQRVRAIDLMEVFYDLFVDVDGSDK